MEYEIRICEHVGCWGYMWEVMHRISHIARPDRFLGFTSSCARPTSLLHNAHVVANVAILGPLIESNNREYPDNVAGKEG